MLSEAQWEATQWAVEAMRCREDVRYLARTYLHIKAKDAMGIATGYPTLRFNRVQEWLLEAMEDQWRRTGLIRVLVGKARQVGVCLSPETRVLTAHLEWKCLGDIEVGDRLVATDEGPTSTAEGMRARRLRTAQVLATATVTEPAYRITLADGRAITATGLHRWLSQVRGGSDPIWRRVARMMPGDVIRSVAVPWGEGTYEDGWMGGIIDGEGSGRRKTRAGVELTITQAAGAVLERIERYVKERGYTYREEIDVRDPGVNSTLGTQPVYRIIIGRMPQLFRLVGQTKPSRVLAHEWWVDKELPKSTETDPAWVSIVSIEPVGVRPMIDLQTTTGTYIAEGLVSHNSTLCRAIAFNQIAFHENRNALLITHDEDSALQMFREFDKTWAEELPGPLKPDKQVLNRRDVLAYTSRRTRSVANHALNQNVGASQMTHMFHYTEATRVTRMADDVWAALLPSLSAVRSEATNARTGFLQDHSIGIIESTSRFGGEWFKAVAEAAQAGTFGAWEFVFVPWAMHSAYSVAVPAGFQVSAEEAELVRRYPHLTRENLAWRREVKSTYQANPLSFVQEYPLGWEESWILPAGVARVFSPELCHELRGHEEGHAIRPGVRHEVGRDGLTPMVGGPLEVWARPEPGVFYDIGIDPSGGETHDADWTVIEVIRRDTLEQVAEYRGHINPASEALEDLAWWTGMVYNAAQINLDATGGWAYSLLDALKRRGYPALYLWRQYDDVKERVSSRLGFVYTRRSKPMLVNTAVTLTYRGDVRVHSAVLLGEMETFLQVDESSWSAAHGAYDDAVNAWMLALLSARDERGGYAPVVVTPRERVAYRPESFIDDIDAVLTGDAGRDGPVRPWATRAAAGGVG